jgi:hypothetical protein
MKKFNHASSCLSCLIITILFLISLQITAQNNCENPWLHNTRSTNVNCNAFGPYEYENFVYPDFVDSSFIHPCLNKKVPLFFYKVKIDAQAVWIHSIVQSLGSWKPVWAIFAGMDCNNPKLVQGGNGNIPCNNSDNNPHMHSLKRLAGEDFYYLVIGSEGDIDIRDFRVSVWTTTDCLNCIGAPGCDTKAKWKIIDRSSGRPLDDPEFCQGEEVNFCFEFFYDASETGVDWFHGLLPDFGPGWDMDYFVPEEIEVSPFGAKWIDERDTACTAVANESLRFLCVYRDELTNRLKWCNTQCQPCPCSGPLEAGTVLPSGWFWNRDGGAGCTNTCSPSTNYGIGSVTANIKICMNLRVRTFDNATELFKNRNLQINFQTTSDGVTGCWQDPLAECMYDYAQIGPEWVISCDSVLPQTPLLQIFVFNDENQNGRYDPSEDSGLPNCAVSIQELNKTFFTNSFGKLFVRADTGTYHITYRMNYGSWKDSVIQKLIELYNPVVTDTTFFTPKTTMPNGRVIISGEFMRCESEAGLLIDCMNTSNVKLNGYLVLRPDSRVGHINFFPEPDLSGGNEFKWLINNLRSGKTASFFYIFRVPFSMSNNDTLRFRAYLITLDGDTLSEFIYKDIIRCSFDPNDKLTYPDRFGPENYTLRNEDLLYTIRFQNTGNDTAFIVRLEDILDKNLDKTSLILFNSSHLCEYYINDDTLWVIFENILLPDSTTNERESQGFATFGIKFYKDVPHGTVIQNSAAIYFDKNPPITTNTVINTIVDQLPCPLVVYSVRYDTLFARADALLYRWYDCSTNSLIFESESNFFIPQKSGIYRAELTDHFCSSTGECIHFILSETNDARLSDLKIFPNPSQSGFQITGFNGDADIFLYDASGMLLYQWPYRNQGQFIMPANIQLPDGNYYIKTVEQHTQYVFKWVKTGR